MLWSTIRKIWCENIRNCMFPIVSGYVQIVSFFRGNINLNRFRENMICSGEIP